MRVDADDRWDDMMRARRARGAHTTTWGVSAVTRARGRLGRTSASVRRRIGARRGEQLGYLFMMTYGRSGSTRQGILNPSPAT